MTQFVAHLLDDPDREQHLRTVVAARLRRAEAPNGGTAFAPGDYLLVVSAARFEGLRTTTHIKYAAERLETAGDPVLPTDAESLATAVMLKGKSWLSARGEVDYGLAREAAERLFDELAGRLDAVREEEQAANEDRLRFQVSAIERQTRRREETLAPQVRLHRDHAAEHRVHGRMREAMQRENLAKGVETRLGNEKVRLERRKESLLSKLQVRYNPAEELAVAVIRIDE